MAELTQALLKVLLHYDPDTGVFTRATKAARNVVVGRQAGTLNHRGYIQIKLAGRKHRAHRLAFLWMQGKLPPEGMDVDHINGIRDDNRWDNLRVVSRATNIQNQRKAQSNNKTGLLGVSRKRGRFRAQIQVNGVVRNLGHFATPEEAHAAYLAAKRELHAGCTI